jgi:23S rRNA (uracil1939-C5)-methyltransferase
VIEGLTHEGEGVGRANGFTLFVGGALPGERVKVRVVSVKKNYGHAELLEIVRHSEDRVVPPCPIYDECGGCQLQHLSYEAQLRWKRQLVVDNLQRIGKLEVASEPWLEAEQSGVIVHPTIGMTDPWRYRNKAVVPIGEREGGLVGGFYAQGSHRIVDMDACLIQDAHNDELIRIVKRIAGELGIPAYRSETHEGLLRHVIVRVGVRSHEMMLVLVTNGERLPRASELVERIREAARVSQPEYELKSICQNVNTKRTSLIFGDETRVLWGSETIEDRIGDIRFAISARSFYQVNPVQTEVLYRKALDYAGLTGGETVIDAYCGIGTISLFLAQRARQVYGVEIVPEAVEDAKRNAELNGITNAEFAVGLAEELLPRWREAGIAADVIVVDPPRKGCDRSLLDTIIAMQPERVVYVSCNPSTLARDLRILEDGGFRTVEVQPVDMFPHSNHVECVVLMSRVEK